MAKKHLLRRVDIRVSTWASATSVTVNRYDINKVNSLLVRDMTDASYTRLERVLQNMRLVADFDDASITLRYYPY